MSGLKKDERELLDSIEAGEWRTVPHREEEVSRYQEYASATFKKNRRINIRISSKDLNALQKRALREGIASTVTDCWHVQCTQPLQSTGHAYNQRR